MRTIRNMVAEVIREELDFEEVIKDFIRDKVTEILEYYKYEDLVENYISDSQIEAMVNETLEEGMENLIDL